MTSGKISNNKASNQGGAIYLVGGDIVIGLESCLGDDSTHTHPVISNNVAQNNGGGLAVDGGTTFEKDVIVENIKNVKSGDILLIHINHPEKSNVRDGVIEGVGYLMSEGFEFEWLL